MLIGLGSRPCLIAPIYPTQERRAHRALLASSRTAVNDAEAGPPDAAGRHASTPQAGARVVTADLSPGTLPWVARSTTRGGLDLVDHPVISTLCVN